MERTFKRNWMKLFSIFIVGILASINILAQESTIEIKGIVNDDFGPVVGATVAIQGSQIGTSTNFDGKFTLKVPSDAKLTVSFIGYHSQDFSPSSSEIVIHLIEDTKTLDEVVVIGYGSVKKSDMTGSVAAIKVDEMNKGLSTSPQELLSGKVAGVSVISNDGQPGSAATIRIRGGSSLTAKNDPLIVIDGVIMGSEVVDGLSNPLSTINPSDIETFTVLKDASATAIYGSRASNGVILITTKKGSGGKVRVSYNGNMSIAKARKTYKLLNGDEYRDLVTNLPNVTEGMLTALNKYPGQSTDWQDEVLRTSISTDHNISVLGEINNVLPYRVSLGITNQEGILKESNMQRYSGGISLNPKFFDKHLSVDLNAKGTLVKNKFGDKGAVGGAFSFDPTKPVMNDNDAYGGYFAWTSDLSPNGQKPGSAGSNPVSLLKQTNDKSDVKAFVGNAQLDYKLHWLPELRLNMNAAMDYANSDGDKYTQPNAQSKFGTDPLKTGEHKMYGNINQNLLLETYAQYAKDFSFLESHFDAMGGYSYQSFKERNNTITYRLSREEDTWGQDTTDDNSYKKVGPHKNVLISFYGRINYSMFDKYLLTYTLRNDGSSRFAKGNRWGTFNSIGAAWKLKDENFLKDVDAISSMKLRLGWGQTGQQDLGKDHRYPSSSSYSWGKGGGAMYPYYDEQGNVTWVNVVKPTAANPDLKWEETTTWNLGLDYGFLNNRINGAIDIYQRKTENLLNYEIVMPAGTGFAEYIVGNVGDLKNSGVEFSVNTAPILTQDFTWDVGFNIAYNKSEITKLTQFDDIATSPGKRFESSGGDGGKTVKIHSVGHAPGTFYVYEQIYDRNGHAIEGAYVDRNGDGQIDDGDLYHHKNANPDILMGFNSKLTYKAWDFGFNGRVSLGNYVYNSVLANNTAMDPTKMFQNSSLSNRMKDAVALGFKDRQRLSDHFVQNASFLKIDNITLGYSFKAWNTLSVRAFGTVQNPIVITKYKGLDPEMENGMDNDLYPRPISVLFGVSVNF